MNLFYITITWFIRFAWYLQGLKLSINGIENLPNTGGCILAINHTSYCDFTFAGLPSLLHKPSRKVKFMVKKEVFDNKIIGPIMRSLHHIEVDRDNGLSSFKSAVECLKNKELIGIYPEATISRSFEIKKNKSGAARMSIETQNPIIPYLIWGAQRIWTKGYSKKIYRVKIPVFITIGKPIYPNLPLVSMKQILYMRMKKLLINTQNAYGIHPLNKFWVPSKLGGLPPNLNEVNYIYNS